MKYCSECGSKIEENQKFCPSCGNAIKINEYQETENSVDKIICPNCESENIQVQIVSQNKNVGCLTIIVYIILACTIVGIPIMILIILLKGKKSINTKYYVCQNCGKTFSEKQFERGIDTKNNSIGNTIAIVIIIIGAVIIFSLDSEDFGSVDFDKYHELNPQILHNDYLDNEISAKDKYAGNYYYFTGEINNIEEFLNDKYLVIKYKSERDKTKYIELNAYFNNSDDLKKVKKGDTVKVYCKFKQRSVENYMNTITSYSLENCKFKEN